MTDSVYVVSGPPGAAPAASPTLADAITASRTNAETAAASATSASGDATAASGSALTSSNALTSIQAIQSTIVGNLATVASESVVVAALANKVQTQASQLSGQIGAAETAAATATVAGATATAAAGAASGYATAAAASAVEAATFNPASYFAVTNNLSEVASASAALGHLGGAPLNNANLTGAPTAPTVSTSDNSTAIATTALVAAKITAAETTLAPLNSPSLTGSPTAPTAATGDNSTLIATSALVAAKIAAAGLGVSVPSVFGRTGAVVSATNDYSFAQLSGSATASQLPAITGDVTMGAGSGATVVANISAGATVAASLLHSNMVAPATPGTSGTSQVYVDSTNKVLAIKNDAGVISSTVVPNSGSAHHFVTAISAAGAVSTAQPASADISDFTAAVDALIGSVAAGGLTGTTLASNVVSSSLTSAAGGMFATGAFATAYSLPSATSSSLGGVKPDGTTINNTSGAISVNYGATTNTAAQGNDSRITGALQTSALGTGVATALAVALGSAGAALTTNTANTISVGYKVAPYGYTTGNITINPALGNYSYITNNGAFTITAPANDCAVDLLVTNGSSAGSITFSGFTVGASTGSALDTTSGHMFVISIRRINGTSTYSIYALQ